MPRSKKRRRRVAEQQKSLDRARKLIQKEEQRAVIKATSDTPRTNPDFDSVEANDDSGDEVNSSLIQSNLSPSADEEGRESTDEVHVGGWLGFGSLYTGILQVCSEMI